MLKVVFGHPDGTFFDAHFHLFRFLSVSPKCLVGKYPDFYFFFLVYMMDFRTMSNLAAVK
jgi:hypothetical protein